MIDTGIRDVIVRPKSSAMEWRKGLPTVCRLLRHVDPIWIVDCVDGGLNVGGLLQVVPRVVGWSWGFDYLVGNGLEEAEHCKGCRCEETAWDTETGLLAPCAGCG